MTAAPPAPVTRQPVPWDPWCWLEVQVATATGTTGDPDRVGYWQPDSPNAGDARYTTWVADSVTPPPAGQFPPAGYGEWVQGNTGVKWAADWSTISWRAVDCDLMSANFQTGAGPWDWNASPGNGTLRLIDDDHTYFPAGPGSGAFDDIGVNTPVRVIAHLTASFDQDPANAAKREPHRVLITGLIRSIGHELTPAGTGTTTIHFSEPHLLYGRVNRPATPVAYASSENFRYTQLIALSDDPATQLMAVPRTNGGWGDDPDFASSPSYPATEIAGDLWTEITKTANGAGKTTALALYSNGYPGGNPQIRTHVPVYSKIPGTGSEERAYGLDTRTLSPDCSPPDTTFNYTNYHNPDRVKVSLCPAGSISFGHDDSQLANVVSIAAVGGTAVVKSDQPSIDRFYRHTYQRHDLPITVDYTDEVARRYMRRLVPAVYSISDCDFYLTHPRDFEFAVGANGTFTTNGDHPPVEPSRWMKLDWGWVTADLRVTRIAHDITPYGWTVTHSYEIHNPSTASEGQSVWDDAVWDRNIWE